MKSVHIGDSFISSILWIDFSSRYIGKKGYLFLIIVSRLLFWIHFSVLSGICSKYEPLNKATTMILEWPYKLMRYTENKRIPGYKLYYELFNIEEDPEELTDLYSPDSSIAKDLISKLEAKISAADKPYLWCFSRDIYTL